jgi:hypothetical protein
MLGPRPNLLPPLPVGRTRPGGLILRAKKASTSGPRSRGGAAHRSARVVFNCFSLVVMTMAGHAFVAAVAVRANADAFSFRGGRLGWCA